MAQALPFIFAAAAATSAYGALQQGQAQAQSYLAQANANDYNAVVARNNAKVANDQANVQEEAQRRKFRDVQGKAYAAVAQSGAGFDGSNADMLKQNAINGELDALTLRYEGQQKANGLLAEADLQNYQARVNRMNADTAWEAAKTGAVASMLSMGSQSYMSANKIGPYKA